MFRVLGEEVEKARLDLDTENVDLETIGVIKVAKTHESDELFQRSALGVANNAASYSSILNLILAEGVNTITIKPLDGPLHLITFETIEDKKAIMESEWLLQ